MIWKIKKRKENQKKVDQLCEQLEELNIEKNRMDKYDYITKTLKILKELDKYKLSRKDQAQVKIGIKSGKTGLKIYKLSSKAILVITKKRNLKNLLKRKK